MEDLDTKTTRSPTPPPPPPEEPDAKKLKMSTTTTSDDEEMTTGNAKKERYKRRKIAIFFAYCGVGYQGMQKNPGAKTIEGDLEEALYLSGAVPEQDRCCPKRYDWARSARTDKGVSAVGQVVSGRFYIDPPGLVERLNSKLSPQIRIFGYKRVTASFNAKKFCDRRRYVYLIPVFALDPSSHPNRESVLASLGSESELVKCVECSERGRKVPGLMGKRSYELTGASFDSGISSNICDAKVDSVVSDENVVASINDIGEVKVENGDSETNHASFDSGISSNICDAKVDSVENGDSETNRASFDLGISSNICDAKVDSVVTEENRVASVNGVEEVKFENGDSETNRASFNSGISSKICDAKVDSVVRDENGVASVNGDGEVKVENGDSETNQVEGRTLDNEVSTGEEGNVNGEQKPEKRSDFSYGEKERERFNRILKHYEGTHNFHNFTTRTKAEDPAARRFIISFNANTVVTVEGMEFVKCEVVGQSFMLHQIRKMIGLAVAIMRNCVPESLIEKALQKDVNINIPTAPEVGLYLDECLFSSYNKKWKDSHEEMSMKAYAEEAEEFKMKHIYSHIGLTEQKEGVVALWLHSLNYRNYPDFQAVDNKNTTNNNSTDAENKVE